MKRRVILLVPAAVLLLAACAGAPPAAPPGTAPFSTLAARFTSRALKQEAAGDLHRARESWSVVAGLRTDAMEPKRRVTDLTAKIKTIAERHYRDGSERLQEGNLEAARKEFLLCLAADPDHAGALDALKNRLEPDATTYTVAAGDTYESIAKKQYGDAAKAPIVARVNNLDPAAKPVPGTSLTLPGLAAPVAKPAPKRVPETTAEAPETPDAAYDTTPDALGGEGPATPEPAPAAVAPVAPVAPAPVEPVKVPDPAEAQLAKAQALFQAKKFEEAGAAADKLAGNAAVGARAKELAGNAWFAAGDAALKQERFADAIAAYRKAEPARKDVPAALAAVENRKKVESEEHYNAGVRSFINQKLDDAIAHWEQTLVLNPEHPKAAKDIEKARGLQQKLKDLR